MPARRSRNQRWHEYLASICERRGGIEITPRRPDDQSGSDGVRDLVWRVRLLRVSETEIVCDAPGALGRSVVLDPGTPVTGIMSIGQSRWMFTSHVVGHDTSTPGPTGAPALRIAMPEAVERCQRRQFDRISTAAVRLPPVACAAVLDAPAAQRAEAANRVLIEQVRRHPGSAHDLVHPPTAQPFDAELLNIGGGGVGLRVRGTSSALDTSRLYWLALDLCPVVPLPLTLTARIAHQHLDSQQAIYVGMAFDFGSNAAQKAFVIDEITRFARAALVPQAA